MVNLHLQRLVGNGVGSKGGNGALRDFRAFLRRVALAAVQGRPVDIGGYYQPDDKLASAALRPSSTLNAILAQI